MCTQNELFIVSYRTPQQSPSLSDVGALQSDGNWISNRRASNIRILYRNSIKCETWCECPQSALSQPIAFANPIPPSPVKPHTPLSHLSWNCLDTGSLLPLEWLSGVRVSERHHGKLVVARGEWEKCISDSAREPAAISNKPPNVVEQIFHPS